MCYMMIYNAHDAKISQIYFSDYFVINTKIEILIISSNISFSINRATVEKNYILHILFKIPY